MAGAHVRASLCGMGRTGIHRAWIARPSVRPAGRATDAAHARHCGAAHAAHRHPGDAAMSLASDRPRPQARIRTTWLAAAAALSVALWFVFEQALQRPIHPQFAEMLMAARSMQTASRVLWLEKELRGLTSSMQTDPNRTGMIGQEYTLITTTIGELPAKRTATNPDFAAVLVRQIASLNLARGTPVVIVVSGSFVGGDVAAITATETLGLRPIVIASLSASMWGANEPEFNLIDMLSALREQNVIRTRAIAA